MTMRKGQFICNLLRPYLHDHECKNALFGVIPYTNTFRLIFNMYDEDWEKIEAEYRKYVISVMHGTGYVMPEDVLGRKPKKDKITSFS